MDTSEETVFLFLENHGIESPFGNLYISDIEGRSFSLSLENVIKGSAVDFEKVYSLDGTFIVNKYETHAHSGSSKSLDFDEIDIIEQEE